MRREIEMSFAWITYTAVCLLVICNEYLWAIPSDMKKGCPDDHFACADGKKCIPLKWKCDYFPDCPDGSDEPEECPPRTCASGQFQCANSHQCIPRGWVCDGEPDCGLGENLVPDTSDEDAHRCNKGNSCPRNYFRCKDGITCRKIIELCNGVPNCPDYSDEGSFCSNSTCSSKQCKYGCKPSPKGPLCYCADGKEPDNTDCIDINECHIEGICDQICENTHGSHKCSCVPGYQLVGEGYCKAINVPEDEPATLLFANSVDVQLIYFNGSHVDGWNTIFANESHAVDFNHRNESFCWLNREYLGETRLHCAKVYASERWTMPEPYLFSLDSKNQFALDWISGNWYFLDVDHEMIFICNSTLKACVALIDVGLSRPYGIALDPSKGLMFITGWGSTPPFLERSRMDGTDRTKLVEHKIVHPYGVTLDFPNEHVYWVDTYLDFIERVNYDGTNRKTIVRGIPMRNLYGITVFEQYIYVTSWNEYKVLAIHKFNHSDIKIIKSNLTEPFSIHVYHRQRQPNVSHPCSVNNGNCEHICITYYKNKTPIARCKCEAGYKLIRDERCTPAKQGQFLLYTRGRPGGIKGITMGSGIKQEEVMVPIVGLNRPTTVDYDVQTQHIYYSDVQRFVIERQKVDGSHREIYLDKGLNNCEGIAVDWMGRNLYWTDEGLQAIFVARLDNSEVRKRIIHGNMSHPRAIVVDPKKGYLYWSDWSTESNGEGSQGKIERAYMDGSHREIFVDDNLHWPNGLSIDYSEKKLYWCDAFFHHIERISLDGSGREVLYEGEGLLHPYGLIHQDNFLYWTEFHQGLVQRLYLPDKVLTTIRKENPPIFQIRLFDNSSQSGSNDCKNHNGGCHELCLSIPGGKVVCACRDGNFSPNDGISCEEALNYTTPSRCREGEFECVKNLRCIDEKYLCDGDNDCGDGSDEDSSSNGICEKVTCRNDQFNCDKNRCVSIHWVCDGEKDCVDGSDEPTMKCKNITCDSSQFTCKKSGRCIPLSWSCDSELDCGEGDNSDEHGECVYPGCEGMYFRCSNRRCVQLEYVCDGDDDCRDNSDEEYCRYFCIETNQFACTDGSKCLSIDQRCDTILNCEDGSDEENCTTVAPSQQLCHEDEFSCGDGVCIPGFWKCDLKWDCLDKRDEKDCGEVTCGSDHFLCENGRECIAASYRCDGHEDCEDNSDEKDCDFEPTCIFPNHTCDNNTVCLEITRFCDQIQDCEDGSDEGNLCGDKQCSFVQCEEFCQNTPDGYQCYCSKGLRLGADGKGCTDEIPCDQWGTCSQKCIQLKHQHKCECDEGYELEPDYFTCKSTDPAVPQLIFSNRHELRSVDLYSMSGKALISGLKNTIALDFYHSDNGDLIFWTDVGDDKIYRGSLISGSLTNIEVVVQTGLATAEGLAVDWIGENIYWVESSLDQIEVAKLNGSFRRTLIAGNMESPRAIALDPRYGVLFWTDWERRAPRIEQASMSGEGRKVIFDVGNIEDGAWPNGLTLDYVLLRVYWVDARSDSIHSTKYDGSDHHEILRGHLTLSHPFAIALYDNYVYWTDWRTNSVIRANKWNGTDVRVVQRAVTQPFDIQIFHPSKQPRGNLRSPCTINNGGCSHLCILSYNNTHSCHCPHVTKLAPDGKTCLPNETVLLFSRSKEIRGVDFEMPDYHIIPPFNVPKVLNAAEIDFDARQHHIYWADTDLNEVKRASLTGLLIDTIIDTVINRPYGFSLDWVSRNMFFTSQEESSGHIYACNLDGEYITEIVGTGLHDVRSLAVHPFKGLIFWADHGGSLHTISSAQMDGNNRRFLTSRRDNTDLESPLSLTIDFESTPNNLYWVNPWKDTIQFLDLETVKIHTLPIADNIHQPYAVTLYHDKLLYATHGDAAIHMVNKEDGSNHSIFRNNTDGILALRMYDKTLQTGNNTCSIDNGNCSHLCLPISNVSHVCKCAIGYSVAAEDGTKCIGTKEFLMFSVSWEIIGIPLDPNDTNKSVLAPVSKISAATAIDFYEAEDFIYWADNEAGTITRIKRDMTHRETIIHSLDAVEGIAVDWIAGNIYWIDPSYHVIEVARLNGSNRYVIVSGDMDKPKAIVVNPVKGFLFWSDWGNPPKIERALLDGTERQPVITADIHLVNDLAIDYENDKLYWCDSRFSVIEHSNLDGTDRKTVLGGNELKKPFALTIHGKYLYWIDTNRDGGSVLRMFKDKPDSPIILQKNLGDALKDIQIFNKRALKGNNPCAFNNGGCNQELCLHKGDSNYVCACAHGKLSADGHSCEAYKAFLIFSRVLKIDSIHMFDELNLNAPYPSISNEEYMRNVIGLSFDYKNQKIFYSDIQRGSINSVFFNGTSHAVIVERQGSVEGLAFEPIHRELYWTTHSDSSINRIHLDDPNAKINNIIRLHPDDKPRGIDVDSCSSRIYWTNWNTRNPSIQRAYLSGFDLQSIITTEVKMPNALTIDHRAQKLYWSDARLDKIERCNLDGTDRHVLLTEDPQHPFDIAVYGDYIFWTDWIAHAVLRANKLTGSDVVILRKNIARPMGIVAVANDTDDCTLNPCHATNGGCEDVCNVAANGSIVCSCLPGRMLLPGGRHCAVKIVNCSETEFLCGTGVCIPYEITCDGIAACPDGSDENAILCETRECRPGFFHCSNNRCVPESRICDGQNNCGDYTDEANCSCPDGQFRCKHGPCIDNKYRCDHDLDCPDASDEKNCPTPDCSSHPLYGDPQQKLINCEHTTPCIHPSWRCDGQNDCWDWSDERNCGTKAPESSCPANSFKCRGGLCIPETWKCDRDDDCEDGKNGSASSDEENCEYGCQQDQFQCGNKDCVPQIWRCDGNPDCSDASDETEECATRQCRDSEFRCNNTGQCIPQTWACDGENDCGDQEASDEHPVQGCSVSICKSNEFQCLNFVCIIRYYYCDGDNDCGDGSDEPDGCKQHQCKEDEFQCASKRCIPKAWVCNGVNDCSDNSDENNITCVHNKTAPTCPHNLFECENNVCIDSALLCNGENDCGDFSDELRCNINECESGPGCAHNCRDLPVGFECSCFDGYRAVNDGEICLDIDECTTSHPCSQHCRNVIGSYVCSCASGYIPVHNATSCKANSSVKPMLIFSNRYYIQQMEIHGGRSELLARNLTNAVALDFHWEDQCMYWSDVTALGSSLTRMCLGSSSTPVTHQILHASTVQSPDGLAVDWVGRNLYWCDKGKDTIEVSKLDGRFRKVLVKEGLQEPRALALDPYNGYMYWTDWGEKPYIGKAEMDGSGFMMLINESLGWPNALTIDYITQEIFWADAREDYIAVADMNGQLSNKCMPFVAISKQINYLITISFSKCITFLPQHKECKV